MLKISFAAMGTDFVFWEHFSLIIGEVSVQPGELQSLAATQFAAAFCS